MNIDNLLFSSGILFASIGLTSHYSYSRKKSIDKLNVIEHAQEMNDYALSTARKDKYFKSQLVYIKGSPYARDPLNISSSNRSSIIPVYIEKKVITTFAHLNKFAKSDTSTSASISRRSVSCDFKGHPHSNAPVRISSLVTAQYTYLSQSLEEISHTFQEATLPFSQLMHYMKKLPVYFETIERVIPSGKEGCTVIGHLNKTVGGELYIDVKKEPFIFASTSYEDILDNERKEIARLELLKNVFGVCSCMIFVLYVGRLLYKEYKIQRRLVEIRKRREERKNNRNRRQRNIPQENKEQQHQEDNLCVICYERSVRVALINCGHMFFCVECSNQLTECPICKSNIEKRLVVYHN